jgi:hypothetical protein
VNTHDEVCRFVDKYQRCSIPASQAPAELVSSQQKHAHSRSCLKRGNICRFNFPQVVSRRTMIVRRPPCPPEEMAANKRTARDITNSVTDALACMLGTPTLQSVFDRAEVSSNIYEWAINITNKEEKLILRRQPTEMDILSYCPAILRFWQANMNLSFVLNAYTHASSKLRQT